MPRQWLQRWRRSLKVADAERPGPPSTADCLCFAHGLPVVPPHVAAFLRGTSGLLLLPKGTQASRADVELVTADEWRAINALFPVGYAVSFDVRYDADKGRRDVVWATEPCRACDNASRADDVDVTYRPRDYKRMGCCRPEAW